MNYVVTPTVRAAVRLTRERFPTVTIEGLMSPTRIAVYTKARAYAMQILRAKGWTLKQVARGFGREDHTTALNSLRRAEKLFPDVDFATLAERLDVVIISQSAPSPTQPPAGKRENKISLHTDKVCQSAGQSTSVDHGSAKADNPGTNSQRVYA